MTIATPITADQLLSLPDDGNRRELVRGELRMMSPSGWKHGQVTARLAALLDRHVEQHNLGVVFGAETGFLIARNPDTVRAPDAAFIARENLPAEDPTEAFWPGPPDLAAEVLSPSDKKSEVDEKIAAWLAAGCRLVWVVDPAKQTVTSYRSSTDIEIRSVEDQLDGGDVVRRFSCAVTELFTKPSR